MENCQRLSRFRRKRLKEHKDKNTNHPIGNLKSGSKILLTIVNYQIIMYVCLQNTLKLFIFTIIKIKTTSNKILQLCINYLPSKRVQLHYYHSPFCIHKNKIISKRHFLNHISISVLSTGKINLFYTLPI